jgi:hypothetical protein
MVFRAAVREYANKGKKRISTKPKISAIHSDQANSASDNGDICGNCGEVEYLISGRSTHRGERTEDDSGNEGDEKYLGASAGIQEDAVRVPDDSTSPDNYPVMDVNDENSVA